MCDSITIESTANGTFEIHGVTLEGTYTLTNVSSLVLNEYIT